jgi:F-type H+-transporting ATPase subunit delta
LIVGSVARRYAKALMSIGVDNRQFDRYSKDLEQFTELLQNKQLSDTLGNPSYPLSKRTAVLEQLIGRARPNPIIRKFLLLLMERGRIEALPAISREYQKMADDHAGRVRATVASAERLDLGTSSRLKKILAERTGRQVLLEQVIDPNLMGGMVTKLGSYVFDGSIRARLEAMRQQLMARAE